MQKTKVSRVFGAVVLGGLGFTGLALNGCALDADTTEGGVAPEATTASDGRNDVDAADLDAIEAAPGSNGRKPLIVSATESFTLTEDQIFEAPQERGAGDTEKGCSDRFVTGRALRWDGDFGSWAACPSWCPAGSLAYSIRLKSETDQKNGDDTAVNGIALDCWKPVNAGTDLQYMGSVTSWTGSWGSWRGANMCPVNQPIVHAEIKAENAQGSGDDVALTKLHAVCGSTLVIPEIAYGTAWGTWRTDVNWCPAGSGVCSIRTRVESSVGSGDDTALNGVELLCCPK